MDPFEELEEEEYFENVLSILDPMGLGNYFLQQVRTLEVSLGKCIAIDGKLSGVLLILPQGKEQFIRSPTP